MTGNLTVEADISFLGPCSRRPVFHEHPSQDDILPLEHHRVTVRAINEERRSRQLDRHGIEIVRTAGVDIHGSSDPGRALYLRSLEQVIGGLTGARHVVALGNGVIRRSERARRHLRDGTTVPGRFAHCDFSRATAGSRRWVEWMLSAEEARERLCRRYAIYNVWQSLSDPPQDTPLAFCDPTTLCPDDVVGCDQILRNTQGDEIFFELSLLRFSANQRWLYFPDLRRDELLIFTGYDSDPARAQGLAHAAFTDPSCSTDAVPRESIDERLIAFFD